MALETRDRGPEAEGVVGPAELEDAVVQEEGRFFLTGRSLPGLPLPTLRIGEAGDGWRAIDQLGAEVSFHCSFPMLQEVPDQHKSAWAQAYSEVLRQWRDAASEEERDRALMWLGFLPQALQQKHCHRGGKQARAVSPGVIGGA